MIAVIKTGGKQYIIKEGTTLYVEKLPGQVGEKVVFGEVLLMVDEKGKMGEMGETVKIGAPYIQGARVEATILEQGRADKVTVIKYKRKVRYKRKRGHRQHYTQVRITGIQP